MKSQPALRRFLRPRGPFAVVMRATGYALHPGVLTNDPVVLNHARAMILILASQIVQDDSGLPFVVIRKHLARVHVFGSYRGFALPELAGLQKAPGSVLKGLYEKDLSAAPSLGVLPFNFGHRSTVEPGKAEKDAWVKRANWKGAVMIVASTLPRA
jgi:hypothetical protein